MSGCLQKTGLGERVAAGTLERVTAGGGESREEASASEVIPKAVKWEAILSFLPSTCLPDSSNASHWPKLPGSQLLGPWEKVFPVIQSSTGDRERLAPRTEKYPADCELS